MSEDGILKIRIDRDSEMELILTLGRARRGASGALYPKSAIAGLKSCSRFFALRYYSGRAVMKIGSCVAEYYEPRQVRKEATVNSKFWVPQESLVRASWQEQADE